MTDPRPPLSDDDLSAVLDGEAPADVVARAEADPDARARLAAFRAAGDALRGAPVEPLDPATVDDLVGRALAEADGVAPSAGPAPVTVTPLPPTRRPRHAPPWLVAAAVVALVAIGLGLVWSGRGGDEGGDLATGAAREESSDAGGSGQAADDATEGDLSEAPASEGGGGGSELGSDPDRAAPGDGAASLVDLGAFADAEALRAAVATDLPPGDEPLDATVGLPTDDQVARCDTQLRHVFALTDDPTGTAVATVDGELVLVLEYERVSFEDDTTPTTFVSVVDPATCTPQLSFERRPG